MEAYLYDKLENKRVRCRTCSHFCVLKPDRRGKCGVRENQNGRLMALNYGKVIAHGVDPIEKKPMYHLKPGSRSYSIATMGCNFLCRFCQNADIAQIDHEQSTRIEGRTMTPEQIVDNAVASGCQSISYTYTEPSVFFELAFDTARLARNRGLFNVFVTNGYMSADLVHQVAPYLDAANVDLKAFNDTFYQTFCNARLAPVLDNLKRLKQAGVWVEVTTLLIPGLNDHTEELRSLARFITDELGKGTPWHVSRFHPAHQMTDRGATPAATVEAAWQIGRNAGLDYVYVGNLPGSSHTHTFCPDCETRVVERQGYTTRSHMEENGICPGCGTRISGIF
ncbi:MAG: AmmeMemoRadiSam system radical SAM enzyme [Desulfotignum sp.]|nr:AmmeMemoRadiSam system radical SAM enzyme [Desulfotignum sp.]